jgi:hypothetical protein
MVSEDGKRAARLTPEQHQSLLADFAQAMLPINRAAKWGFTLSIPATILTLGIAHSTGLDRAIDRSRMPGASLLGVFLLLTWWPLLVVAYHWLGTRRAVARIDARLADMPPAPLPPGRPVGFQALEIVALFIVGPGLLLDILGSLFPHAFDHTPWMGRGIGPLSIVGFIIFAVLAGRRLRALGSAQEAMCSDGASPETSTASKSKEIPRPVENVERVRHL